MYIFTSTVFWLTCLLAFIIFNGRSIIFNKLNKDGSATIITAVVCLLVVIGLLIPMGLSPVWNGEIENQHNQYELMADSFLNGHLYIEYDDIDEKLLTVSNPYDPEVRDAYDISVHWDSAFYNGKYYMYFGVAPVLAFFVPFKMITGFTLPTIAATRILVAGIVIGLFLLFRLLNKRFFENMPLAVTLLLSVALSCMSVWYIIEAPELYCTAIASGMNCAIWSLYFYIKGIYIRTSNTKSIIDIALGSFLGALIWASRPTIGMILICAIPLCFVYINRFNKGQYTVSAKGVLIRNIIIAVLPYVIIGGLLMLYNYARFDNPFEFGQTYQMTVADQTNYTSFFDKFNLINVINGLIYNFISIEEVSHDFPFLGFSGVLFEFPILFIVIGICSDNVKNKLKKCKLYAFTWCLVLLPIVITVMAVVYTPYLLERYKMDFLFIMAIAVFILIGAFYENKTAKLNSMIAFLALLTILGAFMLFLVPNDANFTSEFPNALDTISKCIFFGKVF